MKRRIKIQGFLIFLAIIALIFFAKYLFADTWGGKAEWYRDILGIIMIFWGYFLRILARGYKAEMNPDGKRLVTDGPYAFTRNPMYFGTLVIGLGIMFVLFKWWVALIFLAIYLIIYNLEINREEAKLLIFFGDKYKDYCQKTAKFFPHPRGWLIARHGRRLYLKMPWVKKELSSLIMTVVFVIGLKIWLITRSPR